jgi:peptidoglycan/LPS O-acetylase OafA/YrhL
VRSVRINLTPRVVAGQRIEAVDELKGLAIGLVILYHGGAAAGFANTFHGEIGVDIFLILSGFALALNSANMPLRQFFLRRFVRIYPSYWIALGLFLWMSKRYYGATRSWENIWQHVLGIQGFSRLLYFADIVDAFWFISMIIAAYVVFACIRKRLDDLSLIFAVAGSLTVFATVMYGHNNHWGGLISVAPRVTSFFGGVIAGRLLGSGTAEIRFNLALGLGLLCFYYQTFFLGQASNYTLPAFGIILTWVALRPYLQRYRSGKVVTSAFAMMGVISYEVYLFHQPFVRDYNNYFFIRVLQIANPTRSELLGGVFAGLAVAVAISVVVHKSLEWIYARFGRSQTLRPVAVHA